MARGGLASASFERLEGVLRGMFHFFYAPVAGPSLAVVLTTVHYRKSNHNCPNEH